MTYEKFIDDGIGLIIHPPKKDVEKQDDDLEKYNTCHGPKGRFCSGGSGGGGGGAGTAPSESGPRDETPEERSAREAWEAGARERVLDEPAPDRPGEVSAVDESRRVQYCVDKLDMPVETREAIWTISEYASSTMGSPKNMKLVEITNISNDSIAQCSFKFSPGESHAVMKIDPYKFETAKRIYDEDQIKLANNQLPWGASSHAKNSDEGLWGVFQHEAAHAKCIEHTVSKDPVLWIDRDNPALGDTKWMQTANKAFSKGWQGPSEYGLKDLGECFAESATKIVLTGTSGNKGVDKYIKGVLKWES